MIEDVKLLTKKKKSTTATYNKHKTALDTSTLKCKKSTNNKLLVATKTPTTRSNVKLKLLTKKTKSTTVAYDKPKTVIDTSTLKRKKSTNNKLLVTTNKPTMRSNKRLHLRTPGYKSATYDHCDDAPVIPGDSTDSSPNTVYAHSLLSKLKFSDAPKTRSGNSLDLCSPENKLVGLDHSYDSSIPSGAPASSVPQTMYSHSPSKLSSNTSTGSSPEDDEVNEASAPAGSESPASSKIVINISKRSEIVSTTNSVPAQKVQEVEVSSELLEESTPVISKSKPPSLLGKMLQEVETSIMRQTLEAASNSVVTTTTAAYDKHKTIMDTSTLMRKKSTNNKLLVTTNNKRLHLRNPGYKSATYDHCYDAPVTPCDSTDSSPKTVYAHSLLKSSDALKTRSGNYLNLCSPENKLVSLDHSYDSSIPSGAPTSSIPQTMYSHSPSKLSSKTSAGSSPEDDDSNEASTAAGSESPASSKIVITIPKRSEIVSTTNSLSGMKSQEVEASSELSEESTPAINKSNPPSLLGKMFQEFGTSILRQPLQAASNSGVTTTTKTFPNKAMSTVSKTSSVANSNKAKFVIYPNWFTQLKPIQLKTATPVTGSQDSSAIRITKRYKNWPVMYEIKDSDSDDDESEALLGVKSSGSSPQVAAGSSPQGAAESSPQGTGESSPKRAAPCRVTPGDVLDVLRDGARGYVDNVDGDDVIVVLK